MRFAMTGATGFVGGALARLLRDEGHEVRALVRDPARASDLAALGVELVPGDLDDATALDAKSDHYDEGHTQDKPRWYMVDLQFEQKFPRPLPLDELRGVAALKEMVLLQRGSRLSVQPVKKAEFDAVLRLAGA